MPKYIGNRFGSIVPISPGAASPAIYDIHDQYYIQSQGKWGDVIYNTATGGSTQQYDLNGNRYKSHTFTSPGTFSITEIGGVYTTVDVMVVGGGGGGGWSHAGGGGAGGYRTLSFPAVVGDITVEIGEGGNGGTSPSRVGSKGEATKFGTENGAQQVRMVASGGGGGGTYPNPGTGTPGGSGGGGGGGAYGEEQGDTVGSPDNNSPTVQGYPGGEAPGNTSHGAGGGGAGAAGENSTGGNNSGSGGGGGDGLSNNYATGNATFYAGGGGGGTWGNVSPRAGGQGGGGTGSGPNPSQGGDGTANTGGGGGGGGDGSPPRGGNGGDGVVICRYRVHPS